MNPVPYFLLPAWQKLERDREEISELLAEAQRIKAIPAEQFAEPGFDSRDQAVDYLLSEATRLQAILEEDEEEYAISIAEEEPYQTNPYC